MILKLDIVYTFKSAFFGDPDTSNKEQHLVIFFDAKNNEISSEVLPDKYNTNESASTEFYLSTTNQNITYLNPLHGRDQIENSEQRLKIASKDMKFVVSYMHSHPLIEQKQGSPGMNSSLKTKTNEPGVSPNDKEWSKFTLLPNFVLESFSNKKFISLSVNGGEKKRITTMNEVILGVYDIVYNSFVFNKNAKQK